MTLLDFFSFKILNDLYFATLARFNSILLLCTLRYLLYGLSPIISYSLSSCSTIGIFVKLDDILKCFSKARIPSNRYGTLKGLFWHIIHLIDWESFEFFFEEIFFLVCCQNREQNVETKDNNGV